jgi:hypothetical protein
MALGQLGAASPEFAWVTRIGGSGFEQGSAVDLTTDGKVYAVGWFTGNITIGSMHFSNNASHQIYMARLGGTGQVDWARQVGAANDDNCDWLALDGFGHIYTCGFYSSVVAFGAGGSLTSAGAGDAYVAQWDLEGNCTWAARGGGTSQDVALRVAADALGNVYSTGMFQVSGSFGATNLVSSGSHDIFVAKHAPSGALQWVRRFGGGGSDWGYSIASDATGNVYVVGQFASQISFGSQQLSSRGGLDGYLLKLSPGGDILWAKQFGGTGDDHLGGVSLGRSDQLFFCGRFQGDARIDGFTVTSAGGVDLMCARCDADGNIAWVARFGGTLDEGQSGRNTALKADRFGNCYLGCNFAGTAAFGTMKFTSKGGTDIALLKMDHAGNVLWGVACGSASEDWVQSLALDGSGGLFATGVYTSAATFGTYTVPNAGNWDAFVLKLNPVPADLRISHENGSPTISWEAAANEFSLQQCSDLAEPVWVAAEGVLLEGDRWVARQSNPGIRFFRLKTQD